MLYFIVVWTFLIIVCCLIGTALLNLLKADGIERVSDRLIAAVWLGVVVLSISLLATSLFLPLSPLVGGVITAAIVLLSLLSQPTRTELATLWYVLSPNIILGFFTLELGVATLTTRQVTWVDTGLYHYGVIRWLSEFGAVPGVALLFSNFGFTSSWFALAAPLNAEIFDSRVSAITNGFAFLIAVLHFLICLAHSFTNKAQLSDWLIVISSLIILPIVVVSNLMAELLISPSPDLPVLFFTQVVAWAILIVSNPISTPSEKVEAPILDAQTIPLLLSAGAVTMKLIALPLLFVSSLFYIFNKGLSMRRALMGSAMIVLLLSPMLISGIITSGCPLYPSSFLCLDLPWSVTAQGAKRVAESTHAWATWHGSPPLGTNYWLWLLWKWFSSHKLNQVMALLILISTFSAIHIVRTSMTSRIRGQLWLIALGVSGITFLMFTVPFFRFGLGYLILLPVLSIAIYCHKKIGHILPTLIHKFTSYYSFRKIHKAILLFPLFLAALITGISINNSPQSRLLLPPQLIKVELVQKQVNDIKYFSPKGLCWAAELPCAFELKDIKLRDPAYGIKAGFVRDK